MAYTPSSWPYDGSALPGGKEFVQGATQTDGVPVPPQAGLSHVEINDAFAKLAQGGDNLQNGDFHGLRDVSAGVPDVSPAGGTRVISKSGRIHVSEGGGRFAPLTKEPSFYDIRKYGALPGIADKAATTAAFNTIFEEISYGYFPTVNGKPLAVIYIPSTDQDGWYVDDLNPYIGSPGAGIFFVGDAPSGRSSFKGSTLVFDGTLGGTMFDFQGINGSTIENITFNLGYKARKGVHLRQYYNIPNASQVGSSGVRFHNCFLCCPENDYDSILVAAGSDDDPPNTFQSSEYRFYNCQFQGNDFGPGLTKQGWGFKSLVPGNTKNFVFDNCTITYCYRGIEATSGYLICREVQGGNIGYDRDQNACLIYTGSVSVDVTGGGIENGTAGYLARFLIATQATPVHIDGAYVAANAPGDDYLIASGGPLHVEGGNWQNSRAMSNAIAWTALTPILLGQQRKNSGKLYRCTVAGTTGNAGGPTTTGSGITDGGVTWDFITSSDANEARLIVAADTVANFGSAIIENAAFPYNTTPIHRVPVYDGSHNPIGAQLGRSGTDFAKNLPHKVYCRGNRTGLFGSNTDEPLPDFNGENVISIRDQFWNDNLDAGCTVLRNDNGVVAIVVPASVLAAAATSHVRLGQVIAGYVITDVWMDVTTLFSGPAVVSPQASIGLLIGEDDVLTAQAIDATAVYGVASADRGTAWDANRIVVPPHGATSDLTLKCTVGGGLASSINAGSLTLYVEHHRLGAS